MEDPLEGLFDLLATRSSSESAEERYYGAHFMTGPVYGTRCSTVILIDDQGGLTFAERSFDAERVAHGRGPRDVRDRVAAEPPQPTRCASHAAIAAISSTQTLCGIG